VVLRRSNPTFTRAGAGLAGLFVLLCALAAADRPAAAARAQAVAAAKPATAHLSITVPQDDTILAVGDKMLPIEGTTRVYETPPLAPGTTTRLTFVATWQPNSYTTITRRRVVEVKPGDRLNVNLSVEDPNDRVRVIYVPTPFDVANEMVKLAGVTSRDVAFEPGCGDARVTIAAVKGGARKAVGIDIDPDRVAESRTRVKEAGLSDRIEIRLGDALDIKDLSTASVVFLYMGDHFNMLIRPILWRDLKVGARVVSHRFLMGDWKPDKTVTITSEEGGDFELHLWTVTAELKKKLAQN
jgi:uncharacterized protein (TIGR03000 family)